VKPPIRPAADRPKGFGGAGPAGTRPSTGRDSSRSPAAAAAANAAAERARIEAALDQLNRDLQKLRIDFQLFMAGQIPVPPDELRERIAARLRDLRSLNLGAADSFRLGTFEALYNSLGELHGRRLREREEGRRAAQRIGEPREPAHDAYAGIAVGQASDARALEALYSGLYAGGGASRVDFDSFRGYIQGQVEAIRQKTGCSQVMFRVTNEEGRLKLKAKPLA
jgi:hypothetical protein